MKKLVLAFALLMAMPPSAIGAGNDTATATAQVVVDADIARFWAAHDAIRATSDPQERCA